MGKVTASSGTEENRRIRFFEGEKTLVLVGLLGFLLAGICGLFVLIRGAEVAPGGDISKAFSFNAALGIFILSTAAIVPFSGLKARTRAVFRRGYIVLALYAYGAETIQNARGVNPRFVEDGSAFDHVVGNVFAFVALMLIVLYLVMAVGYFRSKTYARRPELILGIRYSMIAVLISFSAGVWISMNQGRFVGAHGNIIWLHGLGFHALQAIPLAAWLAENTALPNAARRMRIHGVGIAFLLGLAAIGCQTLQGESIMQWSALPIAAGCCFLAALAIGAGVLLQAAKDRGKVFPAKPSGRAL